MIIRASFWLSYQETNMLLSRHYLSINYIITVIGNSRISPPYKQRPVINSFSKYALIVIQRYFFISIYPIKRDKKG